MSDVSYIIAMIYSTYCVTVNNNDSGNNGFEREDRSRVDSSAFNYRHSRGATRRRRTARRALAHAQRNSLAVDILNVNGTDEEREPTVESEEPTSQEDENDYLSLQDKIDKSRYRALYYRQVLRMQFQNGILRI